MVPEVRARISPDHHWAIILAGGNGRRLQQTIVSWLGEDRPKQYCAFTGTRTMLQHTIDRALALVRPDRLVTIVARNHLPFVRRAVRTPLPGIWIDQPRVCGTAPGVFLPLARVLAQDPDATVYLFPSDHFVHPEEPFLELLRKAARVVDARPERLVLIAARPDRVDTDYGWLVPRGPENDEQRGRPWLAPVERFYEKPQQADAERLYRSGGLWNTMILIGKARTLWSAGVRSVPDVVARLSPLRRVWRARQEVGDDGAGGDAEVRESVERIYDDLPRSDFSGHVLARSCARLMALKLDGPVHWSDWGRFDRIAESLTALDRVPNFALK